MSSEFIHSRTQFFAILRLVAGSPNACVSERDKRISFPLLSAGISYDTAGSGSGSGDAGFPAERKHGLLGMMGWGVLMPIGMITARYFRQLDPCWFYTHMAIQVCGYAVGIAGVVLGFRLNEDGLKNVDVHKALGIAILAMASLQVCSAPWERKLLNYPLNYCTTPKIR